MNFFDNTVNEQNSVDFWAIIEFFILGLYNYTFGDSLTYTGLS